MQEKRELSVEGISKFFNVGFGSIRTITTNDTSDGTLDPNRKSVIWFSGVDVAKILKYSNPNEAVNRLVKSEHKRSFKPADMKGSRHTGFPYDEIRINNTGEMFITFNGVIRLVMNSKLPDAEKFQDWIMDDVIPSLYTTGSYLDPKTKKVLVDTCESLRGSDNQANHKIADSIEKALSIDDQACKYGKVAMQTEGSCSISDFAKELNSKGIPTGPNDLLSWLRTMGYFGVTGKCKNKPYQNFIDLHLFEFNDIMVNDNKTGKPKVHTVVYITPKGKSVITKEIQKTQVDNSPNAPDKRDKDGFIILEAQLGSFYSMFEVAYARGEAKEFFLKNCMKDMNGKYYM